MSFWRKVQLAIRDPSSVTKATSQNASFLQKKYGDLAKDKSQDLRKSFHKSVSDYGERAKNVPGDLRKRSEQLGKQARERAEETTSSLSKQAAETAKALPGQAAEAAKRAALATAAAGTKATKQAASAGTQALSDAGQRVTDKAKDAIPDVSWYASRTTRRIAYIIVGTAFAYGVGSSLPGAVARYYTEKDRRQDEKERRIRIEGEQRRKEDGGDTSVVPLSTIRIDTDLSSTDEGKRSPR